MNVLAFKREERGGIYLQYFTYPSIASCMFCAIIWSSTWIHNSPAPVGAPRPSSIKKKQSVWPHRLMLTSWSSITGSLLSFVTSAKLRLESCKSYWPARFLLVPSPLGLTVTGQVDTEERAELSVTNWYESYNHKIITVFQSNCLHQLAQYWSLDTGGEEARSKKFVKKTHHL